MHHLLTCRYYVTIEAPVLAACRQRTADRDATADAAAATAATDGGGGGGADSHTAVRTCFHDQSQRADPGRQRTNHVVVARQQVRA